MSTIKITQLPLITHLNANTSNTMFVAVDTQAEITGKFTATTLAAGLYENNVLNVGNNSTITKPNVVAQFALRGESYVQTNFTNLSDGGTADYVITANTGTDTTYFVDLGFANKNFIPGSEYNSLGTSIEPMSGYLYVQGNTSGAVGGNLIIGTTSSNTETRFIAGGGTSANVIAKVTPTGLRLVNGKTLTFNDGSVQNTAWTGTGANAINIINGTKTANLNSNGTFVLPSTTEFTGSAIKSGSASKRMYIYGEGNGALSSLYWSVGVDTPTDATASEIKVDNTGIDIFVNSTASGQKRWEFNTDGRLTLPGSTSTFDGSDADNWNTAYGWGNHATVGYFANTSGTFGGNLTISGNTQTQRISTGNLSVTGTANVSGTLNVTGTVNSQKGFIYTPTVFPNSQTAITIDFANDSVVRAQTATGLTVTLSNLVTGKAVEAWITNTSGGNQTFTHGVSAINSTINATSHPIPATSSIFVKYWSMDGTLANTFVSMIHA
jgi:hypothetical protein